MLLINRGGLNEKVTHYEEGSVIGIRENGVATIQCNSAETKGLFKAKGRGSNPTKAAAAARTTRKRIEAAASKEKSKKAIEEATKIAKAVD